MATELRILLLEDKPLDVELIRLALRKWERTLELRDVSEKSEFVTALNAFQPDLILSDFCVDGQFSGYDALLLAKQHCPESPFLLLTGAVPEETAIGCMRAGAADYILKDRLARLIPAIEGALMRRDQMRAWQDAQVRLKTEAQFRRMTENIADLVCVIDERGTIEYSSPSFESFAGWASLEKRPTFFELVAPADRAAVAAAFEGVWRSRENCRFEFSFEIPGKEASYVESHVSLSDEVERRLIVVCRDINERRQNEIRIKKVMTELEQANLELNRFTWLASHDLQEPLRVIVVYGQILRRRLAAELDEADSRALDYILGGAKRLQVLVSDLLSFSRLESSGPGFSQVESGKIIEDALNNLKVSIAESHAVVSFASCPKVYGNNSLLTQVFQNLIANAIKFRNPGAEPMIRIESEETDDAYTFSVKDNGIGIESDYYEKVFDFFSRLHPQDQYPGTGIGLAMCRKAIAMHGGKIWVDSEPGLGSTFHFTVPKSGGSIGSQSSGRTP